MEEPEQQAQARCAAEILVVDDHREITDLVAEALSDEGFAVRVAHDGASALRAVQERRPDLLLLDVAMPVMSGEEVLRRLRSQGDQDLPIILMTADRSPERYAALGADQLIRKPFDIGRLIQLITTAIL
jgi:DNA-binding response OmpR family regulator